MTILSLALVSTGRSPEAAHLFDRKVDCGQMTALWQSTSHRASGEPHSTTTSAWYGSLMHAAMTALVAMVCVFWVVVAAEF